MENRFFIGGSKVSNFSEIPDGFYKFFKNVHFKDNSEFEIAVKYAKLCHKSLQEGILFKDSKLISLANYYEHKLVETIENNDPSVYYKGINNCPVQEFTDDYEKSDYNYIRKS